MNQFDPKQRGVVEENDNYFDDYQIYASIKYKFWTSLLGKDRVWSKWPVVVITKSLLEFKRGQIPSAQRYLNVKRYTMELTAIKMESLINRGVSRALLSFVRLSSLLAIGRISIRNINSVLSISNSSIQNTYTFLLDSWNSNRRNIFEKLDRWLSQAQHSIYEHSISRW